MANALASSSGAPSGSLRTTFRARSTVCSRVSGLSASIPSRWASPTKAKASTHHTVSPSLSRSAYWSSRMSIWATGPPWPSRVRRHGVEAARTVRERLHLHYQLLHRVAEVPHLVRLREPAQRERVRLLAAVRGGDLQPEQA